MLKTDSPLVRAFTKRRNTNAAPPTPPASHEAIQRRQAALRQMGLLPTLSLSQQEAQLDSLIPPSAPVDDSEADKIRQDWLAQNDEKEKMISFKFGRPALDPANTPLPPSPPLTPLVPDFVLAPSTPAPLTPQSQDQSLPHSPSLLRVDDPCRSFRSRSPSLAASDTKSNKSRFKSRARSPLRLFTRKELDEPLPISPLQINTDPNTTQTPSPPPQRKKSVFSRFKRSNTVAPSPPTPQPKLQTPSRSKSLFTNVRKTVLGLAGPTTTGDPSASTVPPLPLSPTSNPSLDLPSTDHHSQPKPDVATIVQDKGEEQQVQDEPTPFDPSEVQDSFDSPSSDSETEQEPTTPSTNACPTMLSLPSNTKTGKGLGISLILNRERKSSSSSPPPLSYSSPPVSPHSYFSPPASPSSPTHARLRGRLGRKGTAGEGLLSVWGGVAGLLGAAPGEEGSLSDGEMRQAVAPTIHNEASILLHMSHIEDEETRRMTEVAFM